ncbi:unnamed protein product [Oikopleura dioica]|uniref:Glutamate decarboxylase n=1 Tax=Oikopleura dioica TaxID=34765 RepID=E4Y677_OIKDI|nr:unnamed protein product [Oikopleura dioica]
MTKIRTGGDPLRHPHYLNQLSSGVDIVTLAADWIISTCNTNMFTYEIAPVFVLKKMEEEVLNKLAIQVGWHSFDGILSPGGSINNLYACMIARHRAMPCAKELGLFGQQRLVMFVSEDAHYSNMRPGIILGIGLNNVVAVKVDKRGAMCVDDLQNRIEEAKAKGWKPFLVIATAGTTVLGAFDPIAAISKVAQEHDIWLHVDAAWGGAVMVSETHRNLIEGVHLADSVTWNPHKLMGVILQCSALLVRHKGLLSACNNMSAEYLFQPDKHYDVRYDTGDKTIQCGRRPDAFKLWLGWRAKGISGFGQSVDKCLALSEYFEAEVRKRPDMFVPVLEKGWYANICFWYVPKRLRCRPHDTIWKAEIHKVAPLLKEKMMFEGTLMITFQPHKGMPNFWRAIVSNPAVRKEDIDYAIAEMDRLGAQL